MFVLLASLFVVMIGVVITLLVLPFYVTRLALAAGASGGFRAPLEKKVDDAHELS